LKWCGARTANTIPKKSGGADGLVYVGRSMMMISAHTVEGEPMSDFEKLINASDLIEWVMETFPDWCVGAVRSIVDHVEAMPSAQPERKKGKWINDKGLYKCSVCNELWCDWWASCVSIERMNKNMPYCPKCGARMQKGEEDERSHSP
jgi:NADH pyrophosphatase NudC (nudix superfamily)